MTTKRSDARMISLIVPVMNEEDTVRQFLERTRPIIERVCREQTGGGHEFIFVDDGSTDATAAIICLEAEQDSAVRLVQLSRNFGKEAALAAGLRYAGGDAVIPMDVDLQDPPELIPDLVAAWLDGAEVVNAIRENRDSDTIAKRVTARWFYAFYNWLADLPIKADVGDFRLLDSRVVDSLNRLPENVRFTKALYSWVGFKNADVSYTRENRVAGESKFAYRRLWHFALDGLTAASTKPLRIWSYVGLIAGLSALAFAAFTIVRVMLFGIDVPGYASLLVVVLFMGGLNLLSLGIMGEYVGRMAQEVRGRPLFVVRETTGFDRSGDPKAADQERQSTPEDASAGPRM